jgi:hypothetical protein
MKVFLVSSIILLSSLVCLAQAKTDIWKPLQGFIGDWKGTGGGEPGQGDYERSYKFIFDGKFIEIRNKSIYPKQEKNPKGEVHEDVGYISYDKARKLFILRQFHKEGFVNQFKLESISPDGKTIVFISESIENIPSGYRARETYQITGENEFTEIFEIAEPAKDFQTYTKTTLRRIAKP